MEKMTQPKFAGQTYFVYILYNFLYILWVLTNKGSSDDTKPGFAGQIYLVYCCHLAFSSLDPKEKMIKM